MEAMIYLLSLSLVLFGFAYKRFSSSSSKTRRFNLPPGPLSLPVIGHLQLIKPPVHRLLHRLSSRYGPIMSLKFGSRLVIVISSSSVARECFSGQNDVVVSNRPRFLTARHVAYNYTTVGTAPYGDHWRNLRRICSLEILSSNRLAAFLPIRKDEIRRLVTRLSRDANKGDFVNVELQSLFSDLTFNNVVRMVTGKVYYGEGVGNAEEAGTFKKLVGLISENSGATHPGDYLPVLKVLGNSYEKKVMGYGKAMDGFLQGLLDECRNVKDGNTMVNHLLSLQETEPEYYTDQIIKGLMLAMMLAGTDTSAVTLEWAMSNLLNHPETLEKARSEIDSKIGQDRLIDEPDISNLPYLQNVVSETFRLYPAAPLAVPRLAERDIRIGGYDVPRDAILMVNVWAIHREPELWTEPEKFNPDRFSKFGGCDDVHRLMPFGNGRRACPGAGLAQRIVTLALGSMIQCFEWEKIDGEEIDMSEVPGMSVRKKEPLRALCKSRPIMNKLLIPMES